MMSDLTFPNLKSTELGFNSRKRLIHFTSISSAICACGKIRPNKTNITFKISGVNAFGPLEENAATRGAG